MISETVVKALAGFVPRENICLREPMSRHTTFRIGGEADCLIDVEKTEQLEKIQGYLNRVEIPFFVIGNGSNLLVRDMGYRGVILRVGPKMGRIRVQGEILTAQAGALLSQIARTAQEKGLTGFEFASGIPGTVGGGAVMNAGAYGGELSQVVRTVKVLDREGNLLELDNETMEFGYRTSAIKGHGFSVVEVTLELAPGDPGQIRERMEELTRLRREKQPLEYPSAGSTFKRPKGYYAGELIMKAGMRGFRVGGAQVSEKHCGFVINAGGASSRDVEELMACVRERVKALFGVDLEPEVVVIGEE